MNNRKSSTGTRDPISYTRAAVDAECAKLVSTGRGRNEQLNASSFALGQFVGAGTLGRFEAEHRLFEAAQVIGYVAKDGAAAARATIKSGLDKGEREPRDLGRCEGPSATVHILRPKPQLHGVELPAWTEPGADGKPKFGSAGRDQPFRFDDEARRHLYVRDGVVVRVKVKSTSGRFIDWYLVRKPDTGEVGWQARKPEGYVPVPYVPANCRDPFDPERCGQDLAWAEGEKDADALHAHGFLSFTFGSAGDVPDCSDLLRDHAVLIVVDADEAGHKSIPKKVGAAIAAGARSVRLVRFAGRADGFDAADYFAGGGDAEGLLDQAERIDVAAWRAEREAEAARATEQHQQAEDDDDAPIDPDILPSDIEGLNAEYCVVEDAGQTRVMHFEVERQKGHKREVAKFMSFEGFRNFYLNRVVEVGDKKVPLGHLWLRHPSRTTYRGLVFEPGGERVIGGRLNLWRGWAIEPVAGDWSLMRRHIIEVLASGDTAHADYITRWIAWMVQNPAQQAEAALVFKGKKGTGKGTLGNALCHIFGQHATHISTADHLAGRFNGHLRDAVFLFADEAFWPGDKGAEGSLKRLITEPDLFIEGKGKDAITAPNRLHVMMASNDDWVVPAGEDERRYAVFAVSDRRKQDRAWFGPLNRQMEAGGYGAMLHDLLAMDLGDFHPRQVPHTDALVEQQSRGLGPEDAWWVELLQTGTLWGADPKRPSAAVSNGYEEERETFGGTRTVKRRCLYDQAREVSPRLKGVSDHMLGRALTALGCSNEHRVLRRRGWQFPSLNEARQTWEGRFPGWKWHDPKLSDWKAPPDGDA